MYEFFLLLLTLFVSLTIVTPTFLLILFDLINSLCRSIIYEHILIGVLRDEFACSTLLHPNFRLHNIFLGLIVFLIERIRFSISQMYLRRCLFKPFVYFILAVLKLDIWHNKTCEESRDSLFTSQQES